MIRNVIFDWSGTLVDDLPAVWRASNHVFQQAGVPELSLDQFRADFALPFKGFYDHYVPHITLPQLEVWFHAHFQTVQDLVQPLPHAREFLEFCRERQFRCFVLSTVRRDHFAMQSRLHGFDSYFEAVYLEVFDKRKKITELLAHHQLAPEETLSVGDMQHDIETAHHGGVHSCAVLTGYNRLEQLRASQPDLIVEHLGELRALLQQNRLELHIRSSAPARLKEAYPLVTVGGLVFNPAGQVLMVRTQKWSDLWGIPGGKVKWGEPLEAALRREIKEETNLDIEAIKFVMVQDCIHSPEFYRDAHFVLLNYTCRCRDNARVALNHEAREFRWISLREAFQLPLNAPTRTLLLAVNNSPIPAAPSNSNVTEDPG